LGFAVTTARTDDHCKADIHRSARQLTRLRIGAVRAKGWGSVRKRSTVVMLARVAASIVLLLTSSRPVIAQQSIDGVLAFLLTNRSIQTGDPVLDKQAAAATADAFADSLLAGLALPAVTASASGFAYRLDDALGGAPVRSSESFGAFFTERSLTVGRLRGSLGVSHQRIGFDTIDGRSLRDGTLVATAIALGASAEPIDAEALVIRMHAESTTLAASLGLSDRLDVGATIPFVRVTLAGERVNVYRGTAQLPASASASTSGVGDLALRVKYNLLRGARAGVSVAADTWLPTGSEKNLLGTGRMALAPRVVLSVERGRVATDANVGLSVGGRTREVTYGGAVTISRGSRLMFIGEIAGRRLGGVSTLTEISSPHPRLIGVRTIRLSATEGPSQRVVAIGGVKWNPVATWLVGANVVRRVTTGGLTAGWVPAVTLEYVFGG
jgi:hypothetical protein